MQPAAKGRAAAGAAQWARGRASAGGGRNGRTNLVHAAIAALAQRLGDNKVLHGATLLCHGCCAGRKDTRAAGERSSGRQSRVQQHARIPPPPRRGVMGGPPPLIYSQANMQRLLSATARLCRFAPLASASRITLVRSLATASSSTPHVQVSTLAFFSCESGRAAAGRAGGGAGCGQAPLRPIRAGCAVVLRASPPAALLPGRRPLVGCAVPWRGGPPAGPAGSRPFPFSRPTPPHPTRAPATHPITPAHTPPARPSLTARR